MTEWDTELLVDLFLTAAEMARKVKETPEVLVKGDRTPVTDADRGIERYLTSIFGDGNVLGEETFEGHDPDLLRKKLQHGKMWIVDPIDGTANFIHKRNLWAISIGYAENGILKEGGVFLPEIGDLMYSCNGTTFIAQSGIRYPDKSSLLKSLRKASEPDRSFTDISCINLSQVMTKNGLISGANPVITVGSCVCSGVDLVVGRDAVYVTSAKLWDLAGILPCLKNLGFVSDNIAGEDLLSCEINSKLFQLEKDDHKPFALRETNWIGVSTEAVHKVMDLCTLE